MLPVRPAVLANENDSGNSVLVEQRHDADSAGRANDVALEQLAVGVLEGRDRDVPDVSLMYESIAEVTKRRQPAHATDELASSTTNRCGARDSRRANAA